MNEFIEIFGDMKVAAVVMIIAAIVFLWKIYKVVEKHFRKSMMLRLKELRRCMTSWSRLRNIRNGAVRALSIRKIRRRNSEAAENTNGDYRGIA